METKLDISAFKKQFFEILDPVSSILITSHRGPDDDSISSVLSLYYILTTKYPSKRIEIKYSGDKTTRWSYFTNFDKIEFVSDISDSINDYGSVIMVDGGQFYRFSSHPERFQEYPGKTICIDHHASEPDIFTLQYIDTHAAACAQVIYQIFCADTQPDPKLAELLLLGIMGDTGTFQFVKPSQVVIYDIVSKLVVAGNIDIQLLKSHYMPYSENIFHVIQEFVKNAQFKTVQGWPPFMTSYVTKSFVREGNYSFLDVHEGSGIFTAMFQRAIQGVTWGFIAYTKRDGVVGISMRSLPQSVNVRLLTTEMGIGGGHDRAGGGEFKDASLDTPECIEKIITWMKEHSPTLG